MIPSLAETRRFFHENDWRTIMRRMNERDTHPFIQFMKYGICGVGAVVVSQSIFFALSIWVLPALDEGLEKEVRATNSLINNSIAFFFGNLFAYYTNSKWVFTPGRHGKLVEFLLFTGVSSISFVAGIFAGPYLIYRYGISTVLAQVFMLVISALVNFVCRKFFVFKN